MKMTGGKKIPYHSMIGDIEFKDVNFSYPTRPDHVCCIIASVKFIIVQKKIIFTLPYVVSIGSIEF